MELSLLEKIGIIFKYTFSSFLSIEMFIMSLLLFVILLINSKRKSYLVQLIAIGIYLGFVVGIFISFTDYARVCVNSFVKSIMNYIYFPSPIVYFFIIVFVTVMTLYTLLSNKLSNFKRIVNYLFFSLLYYLFISFICLSAYDIVDLLDISKLYENNIILSIVQISNLLLLLWILFTLFYHLLLYFKKKYD